MTDIEKSNQKILEFYARLTTRLKETQVQYLVPKPLNNFIQKYDLLKIYDSMLNNKGLREHVTQTLLLRSPVRIEKELHFFERTLNIIFDPKSDDVCLMLETKSKTNAGTKNAKTPFFLGSYKKIKPAWRIDSTHPIQYANAVFYVNKEKLQLYTVKAEVSISQSLIKKDSDTDTFLNQLALGANIEKTGTHPLYHKAVYQSKISLYSRWANGGNLLDYLNSKHGQSLPFEERNKLARQLLLAVKTMHDQGKVHQDIKLPNILVFIEAKNQYRLELTDFGLTYDPSHLKPIHPNALATFSYESPEISALYYCSNNKNQYQYFHKNSPNLHSYGKILFYSNHLLYKNNEKLNSFIAAHKANDMWAVGIALHQLYYNMITPNQINSVDFSPLIAGLLNLNREDRLTVDQALSLEPMNPPANKIEKISLSTKEPMLQRAVGVFTPKFNTTETKPKAKPKAESKTQPKQKTKTTPMIKRKTWK